ncbi:LADA_0G02828g1_1 [Lachancea dasiensis]|uniref:LADA_0G02828g1_1 n=1 Tax=Lachancea dasiensis TaxID=1072105 RepID=A0A1G4JRD0_9SACH|nr:LADA_0G02828g1_1 [Lachancea dasiensis]
MRQAAVNWMRGNKLGAITPDEKKTVRLNSVPRLAVTWVGGYNNGDNINNDNKEDVESSVECTMYRALSGCTLLFQTRSHSATYIAIDAPGDATRSAESPVCAVATRIAVRSQARQSQRSQCWKAGIIRQGTRPMLLSSARRTDLFQACCD